MYKVLYGFLCVVASAGFATAGTVERYFTVSQFTCNNTQIIEEWSVVGSRTGSVTVQQFSRRADRQQFTGATWQIDGPDLGTEMTVGDARGRPAFIFSSLDSETPDVVSLTRQGQPDANCVRRLVAAETPTDRYAAALTLLAIEEPMPADAAALPETVTSLPPAEMLPALSQVTMRDQVARDQGEFWNRYAETVLSAAETVEGAQVVLDHAATWLPWAPGNRRSAHENLLGRAQEAQAIARLLADMPVEEMRMADAGALCTRVDGVRSNISGWRLYLELTTGLPLPFWTQSIAEDFLANARACNNGETFTNIVTRNWPQIETVADTFSAVVDLRDRLAATEITLEDVAAADWFVLDRNMVIQMTRAGITRGYFETLIDPVLAEKTEAARTVLPDVLVAEAETLELRELAQFCAARRDQLGQQRNTPLRQEVFQACEDGVAPLFAARGIAGIEAQRDAILSQPMTLDALLRPDRPAINVNLPQVAVRGPFAAAAREVQHFAQTAQGEVTEAMSETIAVEIERLTTAFAAAVPFEPSEDALRSECDSIGNAVRGMFPAPRPFQELQNACTVGIRDLDAQRQVVACERTWAALDAPDGLSEATFQAAEPSGQRLTFPFNDFICSNRYGDFTIERNRRFFSTEYRLVAREVIDGTEVTFAFKLNEPGRNEIHWTLGAGELSPGRFNDALAPEGEFYCFLSLRECYIRFRR